MSTFFAIYGTSKKTNHSQKEEAGKLRSLARGSQAPLDFGSKKLLPIGELFGSSLEAKKRKKRTGNREPGTGNREAFLGTGHFLHLRRSRRVIFLNFFAERKEFFQGFQMVGRVVKSFL
jgi:hypothetical protein